MTKLLKNKNTIYAIGLMSGTSLDGLDIVAVIFNNQNKKWNFEIIEAETISYEKEWLYKLKSAPTLSGEELTQLHSEYGRYLGLKTLKFIKKTEFKPDLISSHGHTIFHQPDKGYTLQIGNGADIAAIANTLTVSDFRTGDVAMGGQGAPLVPVGDKLLFSEFEYCLNLGGFANISFNKNNKRIAFDNCPVNFVLNRFAEKHGLSYDINGDLGRQGSINIELLDKLNHIPYYHYSSPKSLGREWVEQEFFPILDRFKIAETDKLRTVYEHIAFQICSILSGKGKMLSTGGGTFNTFLIERISDLTTTEIIIPSKEIINYKEAIIFAFLGVLRVKRINNCLASVTGAKKDSCGGIIFKY